jgi:hypothetical protein
MCKSLTIVAFLFPAAVLAAQSAVVVEKHPSNAAHAPIRLSMGPDPGGKTGATVNPETSKTGLPSEDSATARNSGTSGAIGDRGQGANQSNDPANGGERSPKRAGTDSSAGDSAKAPANPNRSDTSR